MANRKTRLVTSPGQVAGAARAHADARVRDGKYRVNEGGRDEKTFTNFQLTKGELRDFVAKLKARGGNKSAFLRKCIELYLSEDNEKDALKEIAKYIGELRFKKPSILKQAKAKKAQEATA